MKLNKYIDHTLLKPDASQEQIMNLIEEATEHDFASVCVNRLVFVVVVPVQGVAMRAVDVVDVIAVLNGLMPAPLI